MRFYFVVRLTLAVVVGVILGATLFRSRPAQAQGNPVVEVRELVIGGVGGTSYFPVGSQIVGFSCVIGNSKGNSTPLTGTNAGSLTQEEFSPRCFVASTHPAGK